MAKRLIVVLLALFNIADSLAFDPIGTVGGIPVPVSPEPPEEECDGPLGICVPEPEPPAPKIPPTEITTADLFPPSVDESCIDYCFEGTCFFWYCSLFHGCGVRSSIRVSHRNPDVVVSVYREPGKNPWVEIQELYGWLQEEVLDTSVSLWEIAGNDSAGTGDQTARSQQTRPLVYREADAIGFPYKFSWLSTEYFCGTTQTPWLPHFQSAFDNYNWRIALGEYAYLIDMIPGFSSVGIPVVNKWGDVYRRSGFVSQLDDAKANAVIAQRVGSIISQAGQPHLYVPIDGTPETGQKFFRLPGELENNSSSGGVWQMIAPMKEEQCHVFGQDSFLDKWSDGRQSEDKASVFVLWRPYECCAGRGHYLRSAEVQVCL